MRLSQGFSHYRILISRVFMLGLLALLVGTRRDIFSTGFSLRLAEDLGLLLTVICALGRLWSLQYLDGFKTRSLIDQGPYGLTRNPLYLFSFLGALGLALVANHLGFLVGILAAYVLYYPWVVISEERGLVQALGKDYEAYRRRVPRFLPRLALAENPEQYTFNARRFSKNYLDVVWFPLGWLLLRALVDLRDSGIWFSPVTL